MLAVAYHGIPADYRTWPLEEREAWAANIPYALATVDQMHRQLDPRTPEGIYNAVLAATDDRQLAMRCKLEAITAAKAAKVAAGGLNQGMMQ